MSKLRVVAICVALPVLAVVSLAVYCYGWVKWNTRGGVSQ